MADGDIIGEALIKSYQLLNHMAGVDALSKFMHGAKKHKIFQQATRFEKNEDWMDERGFLQGSKAAPPKP